MFSFCLPAVVITIASSEAGAVRKGDREHVPRKNKKKRKIIWEAWNTIFRHLLLFRLKLKALNRLNAPRFDSRQLRLPYPAAKNDSIPRSVDSCNQAPPYPFSSIYWISHSPKFLIPRPAKPCGTRPSSSSMIVSWYQLTHAAHACAEDTPGWQTSGSAVILPSMQVRIHDLAHSVAPT